MQVTRERTAADPSEIGTSTVLRYRGAWWVRQSWSGGRQLVEIKVKRVCRGRVLLVGPRVAGRHSVRLDTDRSAAFVADALLEWFSRQPDYRVAAARWQEFARLLGTAWLPGGWLAEGFDYGLHTSRPPCGDHGAPVAAEIPADREPSPAPHPPRTRAAPPP